MTELTELGNEEFITATTNEEISALENFRRKYNALIPPPQKARVTLMSALGWQFWAIMIQAVAAIVLASMRTASMFYDVSFLGMQNVFMALVEAGAAVVTVEAGIVVFSSMRAEIQNRKNDASLAGNSGHIEVKVSVSRLWTGEAACIFLSLVAGFGVSAKGLGMNIYWLPWLMLFGLAVGATVIVAVSGDVIGVTLARLANLQTTITDQFKVEDIGYGERLLKAWNASDERKIARHELREAVVPVRRDRTNQRTPSNQRANVRGNNAIREHIHTFLDDYMRENPASEQIPGPTEIASALGVSKSYASDVTREWLDQNNLTQVQGDRL